MRMNSLFTILMSLRAAARASVGLCAVFVLTALLTPTTARAQGATVTGYYGTQTFVTAPGGDPSEPQPCGMIGGASYWFAYRPPTNGIATFDTAGSSFDTILAVYVDNGQGCGYSCQLPVACNNNYTTNFWYARVDWPAASITNYYIQLDGVNGAHGTVKLNYSLNVPPTLSCPGNITTNTTSCSLVVKWTLTASSPCCGPVTTNCTPPSGSTFAVGTTPVTCTAIDTRSNTTNCTFNVTVNDRIRPTITCPASIITNADPGICSGRVVLYPNPTASDNCAGVTTSCNPPSGSSFS